MSVLSTGGGLVDTPWADTSQADTPPDTPPDRHPPKQTATTADGTHPTAGFPPIREIRENFEDFFQSGKSGKNGFFSQNQGKKF